MRFASRRTVVRLVAWAALVVWPWTSGAAAVEGDSPIGRWQTFDDGTRRPRGMVRIVERDGKLFGQIERRADQQDERDVCTVCTDDRKDQPIDGLVIIRNMRRSADDPREWSGGDILDPDTGKLYGFRMRVADHGAKLVVRGFLGVSLIGRTQTWSRVSPDRKDFMSTGPTLALARFVAQSQPGSMPAAVLHEAKRAILNWTGCAVGASHHATVDRAFAALTPFFGPPQATVLGRGARIDMLHAALMNGITSHTFDFDDTHLKTVIHPAGPVASAILALAEWRAGEQPVDGAAFLHAFVLGVEVECRIGNAVYPSHYDVGWHITGTTGVFGAAAAAGKLLGLSEKQLVWAFGIAATQAAGLREMFGSMCKPLHPGMAAKNGLYAALLAQSDFTSSEVGIEGKRGFANVLATERDYAEITERLGETWELSLNTYKPFACGIVIHPTIDGCIRLREAHALAGDDIERIDLDVHPLVLELTGKTSPRVGLEGKFSVYHCAAVSIIDGACGEAQFSDARVGDPAVIALRDRVRATVDPVLHEDACRIRITLRDGSVLDRHVEHAIGSLARPMSDADLEAKLRGLSDGILAAPAIDALIAQCWAIDTMADVGALARMTNP